jgi:hypothetical protein
MPIINRKNALKTPAKAWLGSLGHLKDSRSDFLHAITNMKTATKFDDQESLPVPDNHIFAIVPDSEGAQAIVKTLNGNGFSPEEIGILTGAPDAERLDAATGKKGLFAKIFTSGVDMGDRDTEYFKQYRNALLAGRTVVGVVAKNDETKDQVRQILKQGGASFITYFGRFVTEVMEA